MQPYSGVCALEVNIQGGLLAQQITHLACPSSGSTRPDGPLDPGLCGRFAKPINWLS
jgi:hypothetical protein